MKGDISFDLVDNCLYVKIKFNNNISKKSYKMEVSPIFG